MSRVLVPGVFSSNLTTTLEWEAGVQTLVGTDMILSVKLVRPNKFLQNIKIQQLSLRQLYIKENILRHLLSTGAEVVGRGIVYIKDISTKKDNNVIEKF